MRGIGLEVRSEVLSAGCSTSHALANSLVAILCALVEVVVLANELLQLTLYVDNLAGGELELDDGNTGFLEVFEEADFVREQEHQRAALSIGSTSSSADTMDVISWVIRGIKLNNPVDGRNLKRKESATENRVSMF